MRTGDVVGLTKALIGLGWNSMGKENDGCACCEGEGERGKTGSAWA